MDCSRCNWYLCMACHHRHQATGLILSSPYCPRCHVLEEFAETLEGACDDCGNGVAKDERVMDCRRCNWYLCMACYDRHQANKFIPKNGKWGEEYCELLGKKGCEHELTSKLRELLLDSEQYTSVSSVTAKLENGSMQPPEL